MGIISVLKKLQRNGLTVEPQEDVKPTDVQSPSELKVDKVRGPCHGTLYVCVIHGLQK